MIPILIQNGITNFVNMLDNVMVGRLGSGPMSGVSIANQLIFIYNLCIFGAVSGAGIFGAQFIGRKDYKNYRNTFRFKLVFSLAVTLIGVAVLLIYGGDITKLFLKGEGEKSQAALMLGSSVSYLKIIVIGFFPFAVSQSYSSALREIDKAKEPMIASFMAVFVNLVFNYILIFGHFGFPKLGVKGAAIATVLSRFVEMGYLIIRTHFGKETKEVFKGTFKSFKIPPRLIADILKMGLPLMVNETLYATSYALIAQSYSLRGLSVVAASNICNTFWEVFAVAFIASGVSVGIIVGQQLGAGDMEKAEGSAYKLIFFSFLIGVLTCAMFAATSKFIPMFYNTSPEIRRMATNLILLDAVLMPFDATVHACYSTIRSGGRVYITFAFDSGFAMLIIFPAAFVLARYTNLSIYWVYMLSRGVVIIKSIVGLILVKSKIWMKTLGKDV